MSTPSPVTRRRALGALALGVVAPGALAACFGGSGKSGDPAAPPPAPSLTFTPAAAAKDVSPTAPVKVEVRDGYFQRVTLTLSLIHI